MDFVRRLRRPRHLEPKQHIVCYKFWNFVQTKFNHLFDCEKRFESFHISNLQSDLYDRTLNVSRLLIKYPKAHMLFLLDFNLKCYSNLMLHAVKIKQDMLDELNKY